jgi:hypothetical protein
MKTLSQILNAVPAADLVESTTWRILNTTLRGLGFERATGSDLRSFKGIAKEDIYHLFGIPMRAGKWADVWFVILDDACAVVNDGKVTMFDHEGEALKSIQHIAVQQKKLAATNEETLKEKLSADAPASEWIDDFIKSDDARFEGKSKKERIKMALGAYYAAQNEEFETEGSQLDEEVDYYKFKQLAILGLLSPSDANKAALGMKAIEGGHPPTQEQKRIIGDTLVLLVSMITGDSAILNKLKKTARDAKNAS